MQASEKTKLNKDQYSSSLILHFCNSPFLRFQPGIEHLTIH